MLGVLFKGARKSWKSCPQTGENSVARKTPILRIFTSAATQPKSVRLKWQLNQANHKARSRNLDEISNVNKSRFAVKYSRQLRTVPRTRFDIPISQLLYFGVKSCRHSRLIRSPKNGPFSELTSMITVVNTQTTGCASNIQQLQRSK
jgi:hypothetical protein